MSSGSWQVRLWQSSSGKQPVKKWLRDLDQIAKRKIAHLLDLLGEFGPQLPMPNNRNLGGGLYELRVTGKGPGYRIYYFEFEEFIVVLLAGGDKSTQTRDIDTARKRMLELTKE